MVSLIFKDGVQSAPHLLAAPDSLRRDHESLRAQILALFSLEHHPSHLPVVVVVGQTGQDIRLSGDDVPDKSTIHVLVPWHRERERERRCECFLNKTVRPANRWWAGQQLQLQPNTDCATTYLVECLCNLNHE